jgi:hypothetical protein
MAFFVRNRDVTYLEKSNWIDTARLWGMKCGNVYFRYIYCTLLVIVVYLRPLSRNFFRTGQNGYVFMKLRLNN